ncbi:hypothetical protein [Methylibium sp.]|uniref:hypothetical protein n=1 Tax=Methylibium sp. TaxID=2067992 RepID=UPI003D0FA416
MRDNFRVLMDAILNSHLDCISLSIEKWRPESETPPEFFIRHHLDDVYACIGGQRYSRKLLKWAVVERWAMKQWCERQGVPLPDFWFPLGWKDEFEFPDEGYVDEGARRSSTEPISEVDADQPIDSAPSPAREAKHDVEPEPPTANLKERDEQWRANQRARVACQQVAAALWKKCPETTIAAMVRHDVIQQLCGGQNYDSETVREWIKVVAPAEVRNKRGRPKKQNPPEDE